MKMMHWPIPMFLQKVQMSAATGDPMKQKTIEIRGFEDLRTGKVAALSGGQLARCVAGMAAYKDVESLEMVGIPYRPEVQKTVLIKGLDADGKTLRIIRQPMMSYIVPCEEEFYDGCTEIMDSTTFANEVLGITEGKKGE